MVFIRLNEERQVLARCNTYTSVCQTCHVSGMVLEGPALSFLASLTLESRVLWPEGTGPGGWKGQQHRPTAKGMPWKKHHTVLWGSLLAEVTPAVDSLPAVQLKEWLLVHLMHLSQQPVPGNSPNQRRCSQSKCKTCSVASVGLLSNNDN